MNLSFAGWVLRQLYRLSITQRELADRTGLSASYINDIVQGKRIPPMTTVARIAKALDEETADYAATLCHYLPPSLEGISEDDLYAVVALLNVRKAMHVYDAAHAPAAGGDDR